MRRPKAFPRRQRAERDTAFGLPWALWCMVLGGPATIIVPDKAAAKSSDGF
jgi:hypothetical protein